MMKGESSRSVISLEDLSEILKAPITKEVLERVHPVREVTYNDDLLVQPGNVLEAELVLGFLRRMQEDYQRNHS